MGSYGKIALTEKSTQSLYGLLLAQEPLMSESALTQEMIKQRFGFTLYTTR